MYSWSDRISVLALAACAAASVVALHGLDAKQAEIQDMRDVDNERTLRVAMLGSTVRKCLASEPFLLLPRSSAASAAHAAAPAPTVVGTIATVAANGVSTAASASVPTAVRASQVVPLSLPAMANEVIKDPGRALTELDNATPLVLCAYAATQLRDSAVSDAVPSSGWRQAFTEGTSLNTALRLARIILLGIFALCAAECVLRGLKFLKLPVMSLTELAKVASDVQTAAAGPTAAGAAKAAPPLVNLISTALVTGVTSVAIVVPELVQQTVNTTRVIESKSLDSRNVETRRVGERHSESVRNVETRLDTRSVVREVDADAVKALRDGIDAANRSLVQLTERLARVEHGIPSEAYTRLLTQLVQYQGASEHSDRARELRGLQERMGSLDARQLQGFNEQRDALMAARTELSRELRAARQAADAASASADLVKEAVRQRACATLAYFEHVEHNRMLFTKEAAARLQILRNMMRQSEPTTDCKEFLSAGASSAGIVVAGPAK